MENTARLRRFIQTFTRLMDALGGEEEQILTEGKALLAELIAHDDWLPPRFAQPDARCYQQYLLYCDPWERFSVVSFVWDVGQRTPIRDHTVWGMVGVLRGAEVCEEFDVEAATGQLRPTGSHALTTGEIDLVSPRLGDIHRVANARQDGPSLSIHVYGANIGAVRRHAYEGAGMREFVSGYASAVLPNLWDRAREADAAG